MDTTVSLISIKEARVPQVILEGERSWLTNENEENTWCRPENA